MRCLGRPHFFLQSPKGKLDKMEILTLDQVKRHLNIDVEYTGEDTLLQGYLTSAIGYVKEIICRDIESLEPMEMAVFRQAVLLVIGDFYMQREDSVVAVSVASTNAVKRLTMSIRGWE